VCAPLSAEATGIIAEVCARAGATLIHAADVVSAEARLEDGDTIATFQLPGHVLSNVRLALRGRHQVGNAVTALALMHALDVRGVSIGEPAMVAGLTTTRWPARLERREWRGSTVLLDAAHNPAGADALAAYLRDACWSDAALVVGVMGDKDAVGILTALLPMVTAVVCTRPPTPRAMPAEDLAALARRLPSAPVRVEAIDEPAEALARAAGLSRRVVAAGSIFLVGPLRGILP
jgi:dihydrofolate synthase/folylpolyglutamate synthase